MPEQQVSALEQKAPSVTLTVDALLKQMIDTMLSQSLATEQAMEYMLTKNRALYERLAWWFF